MGIVTDSFVIDKAVHTVEMRSVTAKYGNGYVDMCMYMCMYMHMYDTLKDLQYGMLYVGYAYVTVTNGRILAHTHWSLTEFCKEAARTTQGPSNVLALLATKPAELVKAPRESTARHEKAHSSSLRHSRRAQDYRSHLG